MLRSTVKIIGNLVDRQDVVLISSIDSDGFPNTKAMLPPRKREGIRTFYFITKSFSMRSIQYRKNPKACIYFFDKRYFRGAMLKGTMEVITDIETKEMILEDSDTAYYSKARNDPEYCVLKFTAQSGRYYTKLISQDFIVE